MDIDVQHRLPFDIHTFRGESAAVLGIKGSGKTNTVAVLAEELLAQGFPLTICDIEGEYYTLKEQFDILVAGRGDHSELILDTSAQATALAEISLTRGISVILDFSEYAEGEIQEMVTAYFTRLYEVAKRVRKPYSIILEEAHELVPQGVSLPSKTILTRIALRGRKRGLSLILVSQRSAKVEKDVLTQLPILFLHQVVHPIDMRVYKDLIPLPGAAVEQQVAALRKGQAVVVYSDETGEQAKRVVETVQIRLRHTFHAGATPEFGTVAEPELRRIDSAMLAELSALMQAEPATPEQSDQARLTRRIKALEEELTGKDAEIARLREQNALLSRLSVEMISPAALDIERATIQSMQTNGAPVSVAHVVDAAPIEQSQPARRLAPPLNESKFLSFARRLETLSRLHQRELVLLTEKGYAMSVEEMAAWLNLSEPHIQDNPPYSLLKMKLLSREREGKRFLYRSLLRAYLEKEFPGVDVEQLLSRLFLT